MHIPNNRVVVEKVEEEVKDGFTAIKVQDSSTFKGRVIYLPEVPVYIDNHQIVIGDILLFAQNSPDTHIINHEDKDIKFIMISDILAVL